jgi:hypothetical protein
LIDKKAELWRCPDCFARSRGSVSNDQRKKEKKGISVKKLSGIRYIARVVPAKN